MIVVRAEEVEGCVPEPPYARTLKVLLSPKLQQEVKGLSVGLALYLPGQSSEPHAHQAEQEVFYVLSGVGEIKIDDETARLEPHVSVVCPPQCEHQLINTGTEVLKVLWIFTPPGPEEQYIR
jgi:mannose-6-phosphate isomerase-like protein (cupin superfamily)